MANYQRVTLATLKTRLTERVGNNSVFWADGEKKSAINEAIRVWNALTGQWHRLFAVPTVAGQVFYDVPKQLLSLVRVKYGSSVLDMTSLFDLDNGVSNWQGAATSTPRQWTPVGLTMFAIYPPAPAGGTLNLEGIGSSPVLGTDSEFIDLGDEEIGRLLDYAHFYLTLKEGGIELQSAIPLFSGFMESALLRNQRLRANGYFRKYLGELRDETLRAARAAGDQTLGARGAQSAQPQPIEVKQPPEPRRN